MDREEILERSRRENRERDEMEREVRGEENTCLDRLLEIARSRGAPDNLTAVLLRRP